MDMDHLHRLAITATGLFLLGLKLEWLNRNGYLAVRGLLDREVDLLRSFCIADSHRYRSPTCERAFILARRRGDYLVAQNIKWLLIFSFRTGAARFCHIRVLGSVLNEWIIVVVRNSLKHRITRLERIALKRLCAAAAEKNQTGKTPENYWSLAKIQHRSPTRPCVVELVWQPIRGCICSKRLSDLRGLGVLQALFSPLIEREPDFRPVRQA
jgi:hypothetical protein